jgi:hypothetical protein
MIGIRWNHSSRLWRFVVKLLFIFLLTTDGDLFKVIYCIYLALPGIDKPIIGGELGSGPAVKQGN